MCSRPRVKIILSILLGVVSLAASGAEKDDSYYVRTWTAEDGLPENKVVGVAQSPDGYLWVATQGGLVRFDGVRFQLFEAASTAGYASSTMRVLYMDSDGRIWLAKEGGVLVCIDGTTVRALTTKDGLPQFEGQRTIAEDKDGGLWISYSQRTVVRFKDGHVDTFTAKDGLPTQGVCFFCTDRTGQLWFAKNGRVGVFRAGKFITLLDQSPHFTRIAMARSGGIWICANHRVVKFNEGSEPVTLAELPVTRTGIEPTAMLEDRDGAVWVGTASDGLFRCDTNGVASVETSYSVISSLAEDREGDLWVGTQGGGLDRVQRRVVSLIGTAAGLPFEGVRSVCRDSAGELWAVGQNGVLARQQAGKWIVPALGQEAVDIHATCVTSDTKGSVWIGTDRGVLYQWKDGQLGEITFTDEVRRGGVRSLLAGSSGDLWLAADSFNTSNCVYRIHDGGVRKYELPTGYRFIRAMAEDTSGNFWAGASDGLLVRVTGEKLVDETAKYPRYSIRCLQGTADGSLWIGYAGFGVGRLRDGKMIRFSSDLGLPNDYVSQILTDGHGGMWFAGNQGVFQVREQEFDDVTAGRSDTLQPVLYGRNKGMPNLQASFDFCPNASFAGDGQLFFSMLTGLAEVQPDRVRLNRLPPVVVVERVVADDQTLATYHVGGVPGETNALAPVELGNLNKNIEIRLPAGTQHIQFEFTALSFVTPENVQFRYQLEGFDRSWVEAGTHRAAQYSHLPPGSYHFKVTACNNDRIWNETGVTLAITLAPEIWEMLWFKVVVAVAAFGFFSGLVALVLRRRHRQQILRLEELRTLERERARIARDLHDDLGIGLTEIGLLGDLASAPAATPDTSRGYLHEITGRARDLVVLLDEIVWAINPANDTAQSLSDYFFKYAQTLLHRAAIRCRLEIIEPFANCGLNAEERHQLFLAFKEALNNVIRHSGATEVRISLAMPDGQLIIRVTDNGHGLIRPASAGSPDGLKGMQERLLRLGGHCEITNVAEGGTSVKLLIPIGKKS